MPLTAFQVRDPRAGEKGYNVADEQGLYLYVSPTGA